jgi:hypothetical protein
LDLIDFLVSFFGAGAGASVLGLFARDWIASRIKAAIKSEAFVQRSIFELKREACLEALTVVDSALSQREWKQGGKVLPVAKQSLDIAAARSAYNKLSLTCRNPVIVELYAKTLGLRAPDEALENSNGDLIVDLRNAMREELGFGQVLNFDRNKAWIGNLDGAT